MNTALMASALMLLQQGQPEPEMHAGGWTFLAIAWLSVGTLLVWSFIRVLTTPSGGPKNDPS